MNLNQPLVVASGPITEAELDAAIAAKARPETADKPVAQSAALSVFMSLPAEVTEACDVIGLDWAAGTTQKLADTKREWLWLPVAGVVLVALVWLASWLWPLPWGVR